MTQSSSLAGYVALVTGATRGLGKGIAVGLGEQGATVYITGRSRQADTSTAAVGGSLSETAAAVTAAGGTCIPVAVDHADDAQVEDLFKQIAAEQAGTLDLLVNNVYAGVPALRQASGQPFWTQDRGLWDACNQVGLRSHYIASWHAAQLMVPRQQGLICTISSWGGLSYIFGAAYGAGKAACDRLAADLATELQPQHITSISVWPGIVGTEQITDMVESSADEGMGAMMGDRYNWETPLLTGRAIAALATDPSLPSRTGKVHIVAEVAKRYGLVDQDGQRPVSLRSLRFALPFAVKSTRPYARWIPDVTVPWSLLTWLALAAPRV